MDERTLYWLWANEFARESFLMLQAFWSHRDEPCYLWRAPLDALRESRAFTGAQLDAIAKRDVSSAVKNAQRALSLGATLLTPDDARYPELLGSIFAPPLVLYALGDVDIFHERYSIAMVGTRSATPSGLRIAESLAGELAEQGAVVVSGLAVGIDSACNRAALKVGGKTVAVLACGLDVEYPVSQRALRQSIARDGLLLTELAPGRRVSKGTFHRRNRLISGLALGVVVVQSPERGGSMITVAHAHQQGRDVFAVPGDPLTPQCVGVNTLLAQGAKPVWRAAQVLEEYTGVYGYPLKPPALPPARASAEPEPPAAPESSAAPKAVAVPKPAAVPAPELTPVQARICEALRGGPLQLDMLERETGLSAPVLAAELVLLEVSGVVRGGAGRIYQLS